MRIHYLQHVSFENPGTILSWANENDCEVTDTQLYLGEPLPERQDFDWLIVMGGPMNIYEEEKYPWLTDEKKFISKAIGSGKIVIGLCLGAQLIADVIGGKVTKNAFCEIGWFPVRLSSEARSAPLFSFFPEEPMVFEWHSDTFSHLPEDAVIIASNDACRNQAFIFKDRVFGFQYHLENTLEILTNLVENCADEMVPGLYVQKPAEVLSHPQYIREDNTWMTLFLTQLKKMCAEGKLYEHDQVYAENL